MKKVFAVIVNYRETGKTLNLLSQLKKQKSKAKIIPAVVNNNSGEDIVLAIKNKFPETIVIDSVNNLGFAKAVNKAVRLGLYKNADYFWLLNPDLKIASDFLTRLLKVRADICGPIIKYKKQGKWIYDLGGRINWIWGRACHVETTDYQWRHSGEPVWRLQNHKKNGFRARFACQNDEVESIDYLSGCCLLIKRQVFDKIGLLDERFFLYYEDADFCRRAVSSGFSLKTVNVSAIHYLKGQKKKESKPLFNLYHNIISNLLFILKYQKNFRLFLSLGYFILLGFKVVLNYLFDKIRYNFFFFTVLSLFIFLRVHLISATLPFTEEIGRDYLSAKHIAFDRQILLLGPPSSHTWLFHGPLYYYLLALFLLIFKGSPFSGYFLTFLIDILEFVFLYYFTKTLFSKKTALVSLLFLSLFPSSYALARIPAHYSLAPFFSLLSLGFFLTFFNRRRNVFLYLSALATGIAVQMHLSAMILVFFCPGVLLLMKKVRETLLFFGVFLLPLSPILFYDVTHGLEMIKLLILWLPYRILRFSFLSWPLAVLALALGFLSLRMIKKNLNNFTLLLSFISFSVLLLFLHGDPPLHYFYFLIPAFIILCAHLTTKLQKNSRLLLKIASVFIILVWSGFGVYFFFQKYLPAQLNPGSYPVPLIDQEKAVILILSDAKNKPFKLWRYGDLDIFNGYLDNYRYLVWWLGGREEDSKALLTYTIYEDKGKFKTYANLNDKFFYLDRVIIEKTNQ